MTALLCILATLILLLLVLMLTPIAVEVDSRTAFAEMRWGWVGAFRLLADEGPLRYRARVFFVRWQRSLENGERRTSPQQEKKVPRRTARRRLSAQRRRWLLRAGWKALRSMRVRHFHLRLDTDDVVLNAWLFPLVHLFRLRGADVAVRFTGGTELAFTIDHTPARILWAMLRA